MPFCQISIENPRRQLDVTTLSRRPFALSLISCEVQPNYTSGGFFYFIVNMDNVASKAVVLSRQYMVK